MMSTGRLLYLTQCILLTTLLRVEVNVFISPSWPHHLTQPPISIISNTHTNHYLPHSYRRRYRIEERQTISTTYSMHLNLSTTPSPRKKQEDVSLSFSFDVSLHKDRILLKCLLAIMAYMALGVVCFSCIFEKWPVIDSLYYFSVVTFTTVGYGDLMPSTDAGRLFAIFFSFAGISIVGALLGYVELIKYETNDTTLANDVSVIQPLPEEKEKDVRSGP